MTQINFTELLGQKVFIYTQLAELEERRIGGRAAVATIRGVDGGGVWVEHEGLANDLCEQFGIPFNSLAKAHQVVFLPFSSVLFAVYLSPKLDEESLGLSGNE